MKIYIYSDDYVVHAYDANDYDHQIISGTLSMEFNRSGSLTFVVPPNNEAHKNGWIKDLKSVIRVKNYGDDFEWYGRVLNRDIDLLGCCTYTCEGALGRLNDICMYPITEHDGKTYYMHSGWPKYNDNNPDPDLLIGSGPALREAIGNYNSRLVDFRADTFDSENPDSPTKQFLYSYYGDDDDVKQKDPSRKNASFESVLDYIQSAILSYGEYGFHIEMGRRTQEGKEHDLVILRSNNPVNPSYTNFKTSKKALIFGKNLTGFSYKTDYADIYTAMHFKGTVRAIVNHFGGLDEEEEYATTREWVYPLEESDYSPDDPKYNSIIKYGLIMGHEELEGEFVWEINNVLDTATNAQITDAWNRATEKFKTETRKRGKELASGPTEIIEINGINITDNDDSIPFRVNYYVPVISSQHNICAKYLCTQMTLDLCNPGNNQFVLGAKPDGSNEKWSSIVKQPLEDASEYFL